MTWLPQIEPVPSFELHLWKICLHYPVVIINWNIGKKKRRQIINYQVLSGIYLFQICIQTFRKFLHP